MELRQLLEFGDEVVADDGHRVIQQGLPEHHEVEHLVHSDLLEYGKDLNLSLEGDWRRPTATGSTAAMREAKRRQSRGSIRKLPIMPTSEKKMRKPPIKTMFRMVPWRECGMEEGLTTTA